MNPLATIRARGNRAGKNQPAEPLKPATVKDVWDAPALYNRETRRRAGLYGRIWRWDTNAVPEMRRTFVPRFIRRHFSTSTMLLPSTRRQRRTRARIMRLVKSKGLA